jgi:hypothetical protein
VDYAADGEAEMAKHAVGGGVAGAHAGRKPGAAIGRAGHGDVWGQRCLDAVNARQVADEVLGDRGAEALDAQVDRRMT